jgi:CRP-like cAMP-binding protein
MGDTMKHDRRIEVLQQIWLFERCNRKELALLASNATPVHIKGRTVLVREGDIGREFFVIMSGKAVVARQGTEVGVLGAGSFFGEMSLLDRQPRSATVTATEPTEVLVLSAQAFTHVVDTMPSVDRKILTVLAERLRDVETRYLPDHERLLTKP